MQKITNIYEEKLFYYFIFNFLSQIICLFEITKVRNQLIESMFLLF